jgi:3-hydroxyisobutyrate dehydrogenase
MNVGWVELGRMGYPVAQRVSRGRPRIDRRSRYKAEPFAQQCANLAGVDVLFTMVATGNDVRDVCFGSAGVFADGRNRTSKLLVDCSSTGIEDSERLRADLAARGAAYVCSSRSSNIPYLRSCERWPRWPTPRLRLS